MSCKRDKVLITGKIEKLPDRYVRVKLSTVKGKTKTLDSVFVSSGNFMFKTTELTPPVKLSVELNDTEKFDIWYCHKRVRIKGNKSYFSSTKVNGSNLHASINRVTQDFEKMYIKPIRKHEQRVKKYEDKLLKGKKLSIRSMNRLQSLKKRIKQAYVHKTNSVVTTIMQNPASEVSLALLIQEYNNIDENTREKLIEKLTPKFEHSTAMWQLKN